MRGSIPTTHDARQLPGDLRVVADEQQARVDFRAQLADQVEHLLGVLRVERAGRLVGEHQLRAVRQRPGDGDALLLADGEFFGLVVQPVGQADLVEQVLRPRRVAGRGR